MSPKSLCLGALALLQLSNRAIAQNGTAEDAVNVKWLGGTSPSINTGTTFGLPWPRGKYQPDGTNFTALAAGGGETIPLQSWVTSYWADGTVKWSGHAVGSSTGTVPDGYQIVATASGSNSSSSAPKRSSSNVATSITVNNADDEITVDTGKITASFPKSGDAIVSSITTSSGKVVGQNGRLILRTQTGIIDNADEDTGTPIQSLRFVSNIDNTTIEGEDTSVRTLVTVRGKHQLIAGSAADHAPWLPFTVRFYLYADSDYIKAIHTITYDGTNSTDFITALGLRFDVPLTDEELYNRHIRIAGVDGGLLSEAVQGITGLRRDPGTAVRTAQFEGKVLPDVGTWATTVSSRLKWIPTWNDYSLSQLSPDGFTLKKRTKAGQGWIKIPGGTRAGGLAYLGGATTGGLAVGLRDFWKRYPTGLDISNSATDTGQITLWLYSPAAEPMDLRQYHDGLGEETYADQLDALEITYEDYEGGYNTPYGIARSNEISIYAFDSTPEADTLSALTEHTNEPPVLVAAPEYIQQTRAVGTYWAPPGSNGTSATAETIETHLDFLNKFYQGQVEQRRWYGFWDYGDFMHTYDVDRHTWRYDIGGYAWDNSELSPDLFFWNYFLRTGRADVYRFAEAQVRHTGEVDVYHLGNFKGFGTRHGVQHWGDSAKQIRVSTPIYRQIFYYLSGGDERVGELIHDLVDVDQTFLTVDPRRKVRQDNGTYVPDPTALDLDLGIDWSGLASVWLLEWERRGSQWEQSRSKLLTTMESIANLTNGFVTGLGLYDLNTGAIRPPATDPDNEGSVTVSHLSASFGLPEIIAQVIEYLGDDLPEGFESAWLDYCYYYGASAAEQTARYGTSFGSLILRQGHSRLTAYAAVRTNNASLAARAWNEFLNTDGFTPSSPWASVRLNGSEVLAPIDEASWISTNDVALYGLAGLENLAQVGYALA